MLQGALGQKLLEQPSSRRGLLREFQSGPGVSIHDCHNVDPRNLTNLGWVAALDPRLQRGAKSPRSTASSCTWFRPSLDCRKPAKWRAWRQLRNQLLERADVGGSVVVSWGASRAHSLSNRPFPQVQARTRGSPRRVAVLALGTVHRTLAMHVPAVTRSRGCSASKGESLVPRPLHQRGPASYL